MTACLDPGSAAEVRRAVGESLRVRRGLPPAGPDFEDPHELAKFAATARMSLDQFREEFEYLISMEPPQLQLETAEEQLIPEHS